MDQLTHLLKLVLRLKPHEHDTAAIGPSDQPTHQFFLNSDQANSIIRTAFPQTLDNPDTSHSESLHDQGQPDDISRRCQPRGDSSKKCQPGDNSSRKSDQSMVSENNLNLAPDFSSTKEIDKNLIAAKDSFHSYSNMYSSGVEKMNVELNSCDGVFSNEKKDRRTFDNFLNGKYGEKESSLLHIAAFAGHSVVVKALLEAGCDPTLRYVYGFAYTFLGKYY